MLINCDVGERGPGHTLDKKLMKVIHIANLACGGHAGDRRSVKAFRALAEAAGVRLAAHLSYPDRRNFGRRTVRISGPALLVSLDEQLALLPGVRRVKFHGALYNEACGDPGLAELLGRWLKQAGIREILAPADAKITVSARKRGIAVLREAFADRRYAYGKAGRRLCLADRSLPGAVITDLEEATEHAEGIIRRRRVNVAGLQSRRPVWKRIAADTICIHSDSPIAPELAGRLRELIET